MKNGRQDRIAETLTASPCFYIVSLFSFTQIVLVMLSKEEFSFFGVTITFNSGTTISVKWATLGGIIKMLQRPGCKKNRGTDKQTLSK